MRSFLRARPLRGPTSRGYHHQVWPKGAAAAQSSAPTASGHLPTLYACGCEPCARGHNGSSLGGNHFESNLRMIEPYDVPGTQLNFGGHSGMPNLLLLPQWGHIARGQTTSCWLSSRSERVDQKKPILTSGASITLSKIK